MQQKQASNERVSTTNNANVQSNKILHKYILKLNVSQCPKKQMYAQNQWQSKQQKEKLVSQVIEIK